MTRHAPLALASALLLSAALAGQACAMSSDAETREADAPQPLSAALQDLASHAILVFGGQDEQAGGFDSFKAPFTHLVWQVTTADGARELGRELARLFTHPVWPADGHGAGKEQRREPAGQASPADSGREHAGKSMRPLWPADALKTIATILDGQKRPLQPLWQAVSRRWN